MVSLQEKLHQQLPVAPPQPTQPPQEDYEADLSDASDFDVQIQDPQALRKQLVYKRNFLKMCTCR